MAKLEPHSILKRKGSRITEAEHHIHFDEKVIEEQMRDRVENPKMKIDEPDTPYPLTVEVEQEEEEGVSHTHQAHTESETHARLVMAASQLEEPALCRSPSADFEAKRKAVYADEGRKFKELASKHLPLEEEESSSS
eukprot:GGOE01000664.1.p1 GENE.GGOE01000664.1~~GGOE01000664.1.p1  ORF type:complete len:153 (-),score=18.47 GGOE01000664.1:400-810(-)